MMTRHFYPGTTEYLKARVTADVELDEQPVFLSFGPDGPWLTAEWVGSAGLKRTARVLVDSGSLPEADTYIVFVKLTDGAEEPVFPAVGQAVVH